MSSLENRNQEIRELADQIAWIMRKIEEIETYLNDHYEESYE